MTKAAGIEKAATPFFTLPLLLCTDGTIEAIKWLALCLMTMDHINKYLCHDTFPYLFDAGRLTLPLFGFVLSYNLARPGALKNGTYRRVITRLLTIGMIAELPFVALGGLAWGWYPLDILFALGASAACIYLFDRGGALRVAGAVLLLVVSGAFVEFWWPAIVMCVAAWYYCKRPGWIALAVWVASVAALALISRNEWALCALPLIFMAPTIALPVPRLKWLFYAYYPAHLAMIWIISRLT